MMVCARGLGARSARAHSPGYLHGSARAAFNARRAARDTTFGVCAMDDVRVGACACGGMH